MGENIECYIFSFDCCNTLFGALDNSIGIMILYEEII